MLMVIFLVVFYIGAVILSFYAYREFKGMLFDHTGNQGGSSFAMPMMGGFGGNGS